MLYEGATKLYQTTDGRIVAHDDPQRAILVVVPGHPVPAPLEGAVKAYLAQQEKVKKPAPKSEPKKGE